MEFVVQNEALGQFFFSLGTLVLSRQCPFNSAPNSYFMHIHMPVLSLSLSLSSCPSQVCSVLIGQSKG
jgi:hypothetical protein